MKNNLKEQLDWLNEYRQDATQGIAAGFSYSLLLKQDVVSPFVFVSSKDIAKTFKSVQEITIPPPQSLNRPTYVNNTPFTTNLSNNNASISSNDEPKQSQPHRGTIVDLSSELSALKPMISAPNRSPHFPISTQPSQPLKPPQQRSELFGMNGSSVPQVQIDYDDDIPFDIIDEMVSQYETSMKNTSATTSVTTASSFTANQNSSLASQSIRINSNNDSSSSSLEFQKSATNTRPLTNSSTTMDLVKSGNFSTSSNNALRTSTAASTLSTSSSSNSTSKEELQKQLSEISNQLIAIQTKLLDLIENFSSDPAIAEYKEELKTTRNLLQQQKQNLEEQIKNYGANSPSPLSPVSFSAPWSQTSTVQQATTFTNYQTNTLRSPPCSPPYESSPVVKSSYFGGSKTSDSYSSPQVQQRPTPTDDISNSPPDPSLAMWSKKDFPWYKEIQSASANIFGHHSFRKNQLEIINATMSRRDVFVLMPTGGGKSLCYQLPAIVDKGVTIVISPLVALVQDQVMSLQNTGINANFLGSGQTDEESRAIFSELSKKNPILKLLYVTPEKLAQNEFSNFTMNTIRRVYNNGNLARVVIDEAHCVSQWGHEFRPDYTKLKVFKKEFSDVPVIALTATATEKVKTDVEHNLGLKNPICFKQSFNRPNLNYQVRPKIGYKKTLADIFEFVNKNYSGKSGIIYCLSRKDCENVALHLRTEYSMNAEFYHASLTPEERQDVQRKWLNDEIHIIVATIAFGLGINKPDVRFVIHFTIPKSIEGYYQESGRAGRDGLPAHCILYYTYRDKSTVEFVIKQDIDQVDPVFRQQLFENLNHMVSYCENQVDCRRVLQLQYLGEKFDRNQCKGTCDNCKMNKAHSMKDVTRDIHNLINLVRNMLLVHDKITLIQVVEVFRGRLSKNAKSKGLDNVEGQGSGSSYEKVDAERLVRNLIERNIIKEQTVKSSVGFPVTYIYLDEQTVRRFMASGEKIVLGFTEKKRASKIDQVKKKRRDDLQLEGDEELLFKRLDSLRKKFAMEEKIFAYHVFTNETLIIMAKKKPTTLEDFAEINGVGKVKLKKYGNHFINEIQQFLRNHPIDADTAKSNFFSGNNAAPKRKTPAPTYDFLDDDDITNLGEDDDFEEYDDLGSGSTYQNHQPSKPVVATSYFSKAPPAKTSTTTTTTSTSSKGIRPMIPGKKQKPEDANPFSKFAYNG